MINCKGRGSILNQQPKYKGPDKGEDESATKYLPAIPSKKENSIPNVIPVSPGKIENKQHLPQQVKHNMATGKKKQPLFL